VLVNNAGMVHRESLDKLREEDWGRVMAETLQQHWLPTRTAMRRAVMVENVANMVRHMMHCPLYCSNGVGPMRFSLIGNQEQ
jgi:hypothetical protein